MAVSSWGVSRRPSAGLSPEQLKIIAGDHFGVLILSLVVPGDADAGLVGGNHALKNLVMIAQVLVHGIGEIVVRIAAKAAHRAGETAAPLEAHQFFGLLNGQHAQQHLVKEREDGGVGADTQRQRNTTVMVKPGDLRNWRSA